MLVVIYGIRFMQRDSASDEVRQAAYERYADLGTPQQVRAAVNRHHEECFRAHYRLGGRRTSPKFDVEGYVAAMDRRVLADPTLNTNSLLRRMPMKSSW